jgi:uncharacterized protein YbbC (DUF1343 family)
MFGARALSCAVTAALLAGTGHAQPPPAGRAEAGIEGEWSWGSPRRSARVPFLRISRAGEGWLVETKHYMRTHYVGGTKEVSLSAAQLEFSYWYAPLERWAHCSLNVSEGRMDGECDGELSAREWGKVPTHLWRVAPAATMSASPPSVRSGLEVLAEKGLASLAGKRLGLITNHTGLDSHGRTSIDLLHQDRRWRLVALFAPEHGIRGDARPGEKLGDARDARTGLPVFSLYGETTRPSAEMLRSVDVLVYDIQDIGTRYYTYVWTMALAMQAAAEHHKRFVVLDRPNPLGGAQVQGNVLESRHASFVGLYPVPMRHGLSAGELARYLNAEFALGVALEVVPVAGWRRSMQFEDTGLSWIPPSPNMPSLASARHYPGVCLFEATNLSVGRGTDEAFQQIGAPWLDAEALAKRLGDYRLPGVRFQAVRFTPRRPGDGKFDGQAIPGVKFIATDPGVYDPTLAAVAAMIEVRRLHAERFAVDLPDHLDRLAGTSRLRDQIAAGASLPQVTAGWAESGAAFRRRVAPYLLYD